MEVQFSAPDAPAGPAQKNHHCWECRRRRLVCDSTKPVCKKCQLARIVCPGYDEKQPLRWLKPGKVTCRTRKSKSPSERKDAPKKEGREASPSPNGRWSYREVDKTQIKLIKDFELSTDVCLTVQAAYYCKYRLDITEVYQSVSPLHKIAQKHEPLPFPIAFIHYFAASQRHAFVSIAMAHLLHRLPENTPPEVVAKARSQTYQHRGMAIRALNEEISAAGPGPSNTVIASIITLLAADLQLSSSAEWRHHFTGIVAMVKLHGGVKTICQTIPYMKVVVLVLMIIEGFGNTTTARDELSTAVTDIELLDIVSEIYGDRVRPLYLGTMCPRQLFLNIISVNHLRRIGVNHAAATDPTELLEQINSFSPEEWTIGKETQTTKPHWLMLGRVYQSAAAVYCISSLQSVSVLPSTARTAALDMYHYERLLDLLKDAYEFPHLRHCLMWPLVVVGVRAVRGREKDRRFVNEKLAECSREAGSALPLQAKVMLRRYWESGKTGWDDCFDRSYVFCV